MSVIPWHSEPSRGTERYGAESWIYMTLEHWKCSAVGHPRNCSQVALSVASLSGGKFLRHDLSNPEHQRTGGNSSVVIIIIILIIEIEIVIANVI